MILKYMTGLRCNQLKVERPINQQIGKITEKLAKPTQSDVGVYGIRVENHFKTQEFLAVTISTIFRQIFERVCRNYSNVIILHYKFILPNNENESNDNNHTVDIDANIFPSNYSDDDVPSGSEAENENLNLSDNKRIFQKIKKDSTSQHQNYVNPQEYQLPRLYQGLLPIDSKKLNGLLSLCKVNLIPAMYHGIYNSLRSASENILPECSTDQETGSESEQ
ncbi:unnamed protein product [Diabrotica balteata]|uniref:Uncharacterized protein n=1 Tax=Diabrotica balteata TaxID=107213 RepID=A0A9N9XEW6_DIABA|nr:unnamed protein product [Diabrotica balteata]